MAEGRIGVRIVIAGEERAFGCDIDVLPDTSDRAIRQVADVVRNALEQQLLQIRDAVVVP